MISVNLLLLLIVIHYVADFWLQTEWMATNKSTNTDALILHCMIYSIPFLWFGIEFAVLTGLMHYITDFTTSRVASYYHKQGKTRKFFQVIGIDQTIHMFCLVLLAVFLNISI